MEYLICIAVGWFFVEFEPLHIFIDWVKQKLNHKLLIYILGAFQCWQCMTFWSALVITGSFYSACLASLGSLVIETWITKR